jgi:hypothetical protein
VEGLFPGKTDVLILANGPSLLNLNLPQCRIPRDRVGVMGVNQSWRVVPDADAHVAVDHDQFQIPEGKAYYQMQSDRGTLFHLGSGGDLGRRLHRHDELVFSRHPFRKRHVGAKTPKPTLSEDGGVVLKVSSDSGGSSCYVALQIVAALPHIERIWFVGLDLTGGKFTGEKSNSTKHDRLWRNVPHDIKARTTVIEPTGSEQFPRVTWPWPAPAEAAA